MANKSSKKPPVIKRVKKILSRVGVFLLFFFLFSYFLFPYSSLKDYLVSAIRLAFIQNDGLMDVEMKTLRPYWFSGIELKDVYVQSAYENQRHPAKVAKITVRLSLLPLIIGRANFSANFELPDGNSHVFASFPLFSLLRGEANNFEIEAQFKHFEIESFFDQYLGLLQNSTNPGLALLVPIIASTSLGGYLDGTLHFKTKNNQQDGFVNLNLEQGYLLIDDPVLNIPIQHFKQAKVDFAWEGQKYSIKETTTFQSENLYIKPRGSVQTVGLGSLAAPILNLELLLILSGSIEKNFGFLLPPLLKCPSAAMVDGVMNVKLTGPLYQYTCQ